MASAVQMPTQRPGGPLRRGASLVLAGSVLLFLELPLQEVRVHAERQFTLSGGSPWSAGVLLSMALVSVGLLLTSVTFLWPGLIIARCRKPDASWRVALVEGLGLAFAIQFVLHALVIGLLGQSSSADHYRWLHRILAVVIAAVAGMAYPRRDGQPRISQGWAPALASALVAVGALTAILFARIVWQDFNPDGIELYTMAESLRTHVLPRIPTGEVPGINLGMLLVAHPVDWMAQAFGPSELAVRGPGMLYAVCLCYTVVTLIEEGAPRPLSKVEMLLASAGVLTICLVLFWNTSYDPYSTDLSSPASIDVLALAFLTVTLRSILQGNHLGAMGGAALLTATRPSGLMLCGLMCASLFLVHRFKRTRSLDAAFLATLTCVGVSIAYTWALRWLVADPASQGEGDLLYRLRYLRFDDWKRLAILAVPSGIVPIVSLLAWRRLRGFDAALILTWLGYGCFFYVLAFVALHHFAPAMLLPLIVFWRWRMHVADTGTRVVHGAVLVGLIASVWLAKPGDVSTFRAERQTAARLDYRIGRYGQSYEGTRQAFEGRKVLDSLFTPFASPLDPSKTRLGSNWALIHYSATAAKARTPDYIVQAHDAPAPGAPYQEVASVERSTLWVRDPAAWRRERTSPPPLDPRSWLFDVPRLTLFRHLGAERGVAQLDLRNLLAKLRGRSGS